MSGLFVQATENTTDPEEQTLLELIQEYKERRIRQRYEIWSLLEPMFENTQVGIALVSSSGSFIEINDRYCKICRRTRPEMQNLTWQDITHKDFLTNDKHKAGKESYIGEGYILPKVYVSPDGKNIPVLIEVNAIIENTKFLYYVVKALEIKQILGMTSALKEYL